MNFKTTAVVLVLLLAGGLYLYATRDKPPAEKPAADAAKATPAAGHLLGDVKAADVTGLTVAGRDGQPALTAAKVKDVWHLSRPVDAPADADKIAALLDTLTTLTPTSTVKAADAKGAVDSPQYTVTLATADGKSTVLQVGAQLNVGEGVYVRPAGSDTVSIVAPTLVDTLSKIGPDYRSTALFAGLTPAQITGVTVTHADGTKLSLVKQGPDWRMTAPMACPADPIAVDSLLYAVTGLAAVSFDPQDDPRAFRRPQDTVTFTTGPSPTTGPATTAPPTVVLGGYDDVSKANLYAKVNGGPTVTVAASVLEQLDKPPLDLRDKAVIDLDPAKVTRLVVVSEMPPSLKPPFSLGSTHKAVLTRRPPKPKLMGPAKPTSGPAEGTTAWVLADGSPADDAKVTTLLNDLHPLRAEKFLAASAVRNFNQKITVMATVTGRPDPVVLHVDYPGLGLTPICSVDQTLFNIPEMMRPDLTTDFKPGPPPGLAEPPSMPGGMPPGLSPR